MNLKNLNQQADEKAKEAVETVENQEAPRQSFGKHGSGLDQNDSLLEGDQIEAAQKMAEAASPTEGQVTGTELLANDAAENAPDDKVTYSSHPIERQVVGEYEFVKGTLYLDADEAKKFDKLVADLQKQGLANNIRKIDQEAANEFAQKFLSNHRTRGVDTSADRPS